MNAATPVIALEAVHKAYGVGTELEAEILHGVSFSVGRGEFAALIGPSGSGKSTLLNVMGLLERPTSGEVRVLGRPISALDDGALTQLRGRSIGFVFQFHHLLAGFSALENVMMPALIARGRGTDTLAREAAELLDRVGLFNHRHKKPLQLSGGQQQRVAIARALMMRPALLLADEPTGNLDSHTADEVFALMREFNRDWGVAFLMVTHDPRLADRCDRVLHLADGALTA